MNTSVQPQSKTEVREPGRWHVLLLDDDFTPVDFVVSVLMRIYHKPEREAESIARQVHELGCAVAGFYTREIAEEKATGTVSAARSLGHPFIATAAPC